KCLNTNCEVTVTANNHQFGDNDYVVIRNVNGMTGINTGNNATWRVSDVTQHTFMLQSSVGPNYGAYTNGGTAYCTTLGCEFYRFLNKSSNAQRVHQISTCVTERTGAHALTDVAPSTAPIGYNYPSTSNPCTAVVEMMPLTSNKAALKAKIQSLAAGGSTAGHLGAAWGWYSLSPNFGYMFPTQSRPGAYGKVSLFKIAVLMTDGEYNSAYCNGVIAGDSTSGSGSTNDQINCNAQNGHAFNQALQYCAAMKQQGITIYTIGFEVVNDVRATQLVNECATSASHVYMASGAEQLRQVFQQIALAINEVRLTR
ncbi:MAG: ubiquitin-activating E1 FCCH domain-containing protein, partial [Deltaproteobacteria bacterium]|nr:ubiquitin-activating E1 FCCH domain-containing protein [Deltaproteobacteria bacterium]